MRDMHHFITKCICRIHFLTGCLCRDLCTATRSGSRPAEDLRKCRNGPSLLACERDLPSGTTRHLNSWKVHGLTPKV